MKKFLCILLLVGVMLSSKPIFADISSEDAALITWLTDHIKDAGGDPEKQAAFEKELEYRIGGSNENASLTRLGNWCRDHKIVMTATGVLAVVIIAGIIRGTGKSKSTEQEQNLPKEASKKSTDVPKETFSHWEPRGIDVPKFDHVTPGPVPQFKPYNYNSTIPAKTYESPLYRNGYIDAHGVYRTSTGYGASTGYGVPAYDYRNPNRFYWETQNQPRSYYSNYPFGVNNQNRFPYGK